VHENTFAQRFAERRRLLYLTFVKLQTGHITTHYCIVLMFYGYMQNAHYFILVFGWVGGGMGGISPFSGFVSPFSCFVFIDNKLYKWYERSMRRMVHGTNGLHVVRIVNGTKSQDTILNT